MVYVMLAIWGEQARQARQALIAMLVGLSSPMAVVFWFKHLAPPNDTVGQQSISQIVAAIVDWQRYFVVAGSFIEHGVLFGHWLVSPVLVLLVFWFFAPKQVNFSQNLSIRAVSWTLMLMLVGYFFTYMIQPTDLAHIMQKMTYSLDRLFVALWPSILVLAFCTLAFGGAKNDGADCTLATGSS